MNATACYHCQLDIPAGTNFSATVDGIQAYFCCPGCQAVAETILNLGLKNYYQHRDGPNSQAKSILPDFLRKLEIYDLKEIQNQFVVKDDNTSIYEASILIEGMHCSACIWLIEKHLCQIPGVLKININLSTHKALIRWDSSSIKLSQIIYEVYKLGYQAAPNLENSKTNHQQSIRHKALIRLGVSGLGMMQIMMFAIALTIGAYSDIEFLHVKFIRWVSCFVTTGILIYSGWPFIHSALLALRSKALNMDVPVSIALLTTYIASVISTVYDGKEVYFDSICMFIFFLSLSKYLELSARLKLSAPVLTEELPLCATKVEGDTEEITPITNLKVGDRIRVKPGETIPADGYIIDGQSSISESLLTGESFPKTKGINDKLLSGTQNIDQPLLVEITQVGSNTTLAYISHLIEKAAVNKPKIVEITQKIAGYFIAFVLITAGCTAIFWGIHDPTQIFNNTISVLVITCPCALSLAVPTVVTKATYTFMKQGLLIVNNHVLEGLMQISDIVFDKTGTLTEGNLSVKKYEILNKQSKQEIFNIVYNFEKNSEHPIAKALCTLCHDFAHPLKNYPIKIHQNNGIEGIINNKKYRIGHPAFAQSIVKESKQNFSFQNSMYCMLASEDDVLAWFELYDPIRYGTKSSIQSLKSINLKTHILSGDPSQDPKNVQKALNIDYCTHHASFKDKVQYVENLINLDKKVLMIGDGINDAPVLKTATISIAMNQGTELAKTSADAILLSNQISNLPTLFKIAQNANQIMKQNLFWAISYNLIALPLAVCGWVEPYQAAIGMSFSSLVVVLNALRLDNSKMASCTQGSSIS